MWRLGARHRKARRPPDGWKPPNSARDASVRTRRRRLAAASRGHGGQVARLVVLRGGLGGGVEAERGARRREAAKVRAVALDAVEDAAQDVQRILEQLAVAVLVA